MDNHYETLQKNQLYIDKTACLEKGIAVFPSIYVEGAAASGKTTAVKMLLEKHPEVTSCVIWMGEEQENLRDTLDGLMERMKQETIWVIVEDFHKIQSGEICSMFCAWISQIPGKSRVILLGREYLPEEFLSLLWKGKLDIIFQEELLFTRSEVQQMTEAAACPYGGEELYRLTGGWAGYVALSCRLWKPYRTLQQLQDSYEIRCYIQRELLESCSKEEQQVLGNIAQCPWVTEALCKELWHWQNGKELMGALHRKGFLLYEPIRKRYKLAPILVGHVEIREKFDFEKLALWYEEKNFIKEALLILYEKAAKDAYMEALLRHYKKIPFMQISYDMVMQKTGESLALHYLRGMKCYEKQDLEGLAQEIACVKKWKPKTEEEKKSKKEIYLNLMYVDPGISLEEWLSLLETEEKIQLYGMLGGGYSYLCGTRDLTGLFTGTRKEEKQKAKIWKEHLGEWEWMAYQLARTDYYLETKREDALLEEDEKLLRGVTGQDMEQSLLHSGQEMWKVRLCGFYLLCKRMGNKRNDSSKEQIRWLESSLLTEESELCIRNTEAIAGLYATWLREPERLSRWLRSLESETWDSVSEKNYGALCLEAKGYILLGHYKKAEKILTKLLPYLQLYRKNRFYAEGLFQMAMVNWQKGKKGQALRNTLESFLISEKNRYVGFYIRYGAVGREVLESYTEWLKQTTPERWHRKKKYNYGNVNHMPMEDYLEVILRGAKKEMRHQEEFRKYKEEESLTMMETIILQDISRGLSNQEICQEQNLKLPTVKSHIYSLYKKLGVNNRMQAVNRGKERGIIK